MADFQYNREIAFYRVKVYEWTEKFENDRTSVWCKDLTSRRDRFGEQTNGHL